MSGKKSIHEMTKEEIDEMLRENLIKLISDPGITDEIRAVLIGNDLSLMGYAPIKDMHKQFN